MMPLASPLRESLLLVHRPAAGTKSPPPSPGGGLFFGTSTDRPECRRFVPQVKHKLGVELNLASLESRVQPSEFQWRYTIQGWGCPNSGNGVWEFHPIVRIMHMECLSPKHALVSLPARCASISAPRKEGRVCARL